MYMRLCACRDFEVSHVWHRAIFMTAFLLGCFTAYGNVVSLLFDKDHHFAYTWYANVAAFGVTLIGIVISLFWIMMAKGSKAWYEVYENAIATFVAKYPAGVDPNAGELSKCKWDKSNTKIGTRSPCCLCRLVRFWKVNCPLSPSGGAYSVSRINVGIGQLALLIWLILAFAHICIAVKYSPSLQSSTLDQLSCLKNLLIQPWIMIVVLLGVVVVLQILICWWFRSKCLGDSKK